jgi:hypothetical protein
LDLSGLRSEDKERRDMNENSSGLINKLSAPAFPYPSNAKEKLDQKDGGIRGKIGLVYE